MDLPDLSGPSKTMKSPRSCGGIAGNFSNSPGSGAGPLRVHDVLPGDPRIRFLDLNGDGLTDILYDTGRSWLAYLRAAGASSAWDSYPVVLPAAATPPVSLTDPHVYLADMTGDGRTDIVEVNGGGATYWPARADGGWGAAVRMSPAPILPRNWQPSRLSVFDADGDGCADLVYVGDTSVTVWLNTGAGRLAAPVTTGHTPPAVPGSYRLADLFGQGVAGVCFQLPAIGTAGAARQSFLDLSGGVKPGLLSDIGNGPGQHTQVTYEPSTSFAAADAAVGTPWPTYHPFPVQCVARTDQTDLGTGRTATLTYAYHDGRYDPATRTFLGFGRVTVDQVGDASCPTLRTESVFHLGLDPANPARPLSPAEAIQFGALRRKVLQVTTWGLDGTAAQSQPYSVVTSSYAATLIPSTQGDGTQVAVPYTVSTTEERWERQSAALSSRLVQYLSVTDEGDIASQRTTATRTGQADPDQDVLTTTTFAVGGKNLRLPARVTQTLPDGTIIGATVTYYDGPAYTGLPEGQATLGLETRTEDLAFTSAFVTQVWGANPPDLTSYGYHQLPGDTTGWWITRVARERVTTIAGPTLRTKGALGATAVTQLDATGQRVTSVTDAVGNTLQATADPRTAQTASLTDPNGHPTTDVFDQLGRVTATIKPGDTGALPWAAYSYTVDTISQVAATARIEHGQQETLTAITFTDGTGAVLGKAGPSATPGSWVVSQGVARNRRGLPTSAYLPYEITSPAWQPPPAGTAATSYTYDALGRVVSKTRPDGLTAVTRREGDTLIISEQWPGGQATDVERQTFDACGQLVSVSRWDAGGHWVEQDYSYTPGGRASGVTLAGGGSVTFGYDLLGRRFSLQSPDTGRTVYLLDACGNERLRTLPTGQQVRSEVDALNRVTGIYYDAETTPRISYAYYDQGGTAPADGITANRVGRVWRVTDELGTVTFQYDENGRVTSNARTVTSGGASYAESYSYDALGRATSVTLPPTSDGGAGRTVAYGYGPDGRLATASGVVTGTSYDVTGRPTEIDYANGTKTLIDYRPGGGTIARVRVLDPTAAVLRDQSVTVEQALVTAVTSAASDDDSVTFGYDGLKRLSSANYSGGGISLDAHSWGYDDTFNVTSASDAGTLAYTSGTHQLSVVAGVAVTFDAAGRMTRGRPGTLVFDAADHLTQATTPAGHVVGHTYGYTGLRVRTTVDGTETHLAPTDNYVIRGGQQVAWISFGPLRVAAEVDGALWFTHAGPLGETDMFTDASGHAAGRAKLTPYGLARPVSSTPAQAVATLTLLLTGADDTGLSCVGQRWLDPVTGQFISPDPIVTGIFTIGAWHPYLYCLGNPIALADPSGCDFWSVLEIIGIAVLAAACVVAAIWTGGASLVALGVLTANLSTGMLVSVSIGALGGAIAGELAAQKAGGSIWAGAFVGALLGGVTSLAGGVLGSVVGGALKSLPFLSYVASGTIQGAIAGLGTGAATGFAGGKGSAEQVLMSAAMGAAWGAALGAVLSAGTYGLLGTVPQGKTAYLQIGNIVNKYDPDPAVQDSLGDVINTFDNDAGFGNDVGVLATKFDASNALGMLPDFIGVQNSSQSLGLFLSGGSLVNIPLNWVPQVVVSNGGFAAVVTVSFAADQAGFSYADQVSLLMKAVPYFVDYAFTLFQEGYPNDWDWLGNQINQAFSSANPNEYP